MKRLMTLLLAGIALLWILPGLGRADAASDCNGHRDLDLQIKACSILLEDSATSPANRVIAFGNRGNAFGMQHRPKQALDDYAAAIALDSHDPLVFYNRANVLFDLGRMDDAERDYSRAIDLDDAFALAYFNRGLAREKRGDLIGATDDYRIVEKFDDPLADKAKARRERLGAARPARQGAAPGN